MNDYLEFSYSKRHVKEVTKKKVINEMNQVLKILGDISLFTVDNYTLMHHFNGTKLYSNETVRRLACRVN